MENVGLERRRRLAKYRFKWLIKKVIQNLHWLTVYEETEVDKVTHATWRKVKEPLKVHHKGILMTPANLRTEEQKAIIKRVIGYYKCFRKYPEDIQGKLAGCTYFSYVPAGKIVVRKGHPGHAMYFLINGNVEVYSEFYDNFEGVTKLKFNYALGPGAIFGEVSLYHQLPRENTILTSAPCEFLMLQVEHFNVVLKETVQDLWDVILNALDSFIYFKSWDYGVKRECCVVSKIKLYAKDSIILQDKIKNTYVHFLLKGRCVVIQCLKLKEKKSFGRSEHRKSQEEAPQLPRFSLRTEESTDDNYGDLNKKSSVKFRTERTTKKSLFKYSISSAIQFKEASSANFRESSIFDAIMENKLSLKRRQNTNASMYKFSKMQFINKDTEDADTYFVQTHFFNEKSVFNIGEKIPNSYTVADTNVEILLIPFWWLQNNSEFHTWTLLREYLERNICTGNELMKLFKERKQWREYSRELASNYKKPTPCNTISNIPYSLRIKYDYFYKETLPKPNIKNRYS